MEANGTELAEALRMEEKDGFEKILRVTKRCVLDRN